MKFTTLAALSVLALSLGLDGQAVPREKLFGGQSPATVNGKPILVSDIEGYLWDWYASAVVEDLITYRLILDEATKLGLSVGPSDVDAEVERQMKAVDGQLTAGQTRSQFLRAQGFPESRIRMRITSTLLLDAIVLKRFDPKQYVEVSTVIVTPKSDAASDVAEAIQRAQQAYDDLKGGKSWREVLRGIVTDEETLRSNGKLGWRVLSVFPTSIQTEFATLEKGAFTKPVQTVNGIQIFRLDERGASASEETLKSLRTQALNEGRTAEVNRIRAEGKVVRAPMP